MAVITKTAHTGLLIPYVLILPQLCSEQGLAGCRMCCYRTVEVERAAPCQERAAPTEESEALTPIF